MSQAAPLYFPNAPNWVWHWVFWLGISIMALMLLDLALLLAWDDKRSRIGPALSINTGVLLVLVGLIWRFEAAPNLPIAPPAIEQPDGVGKLKPRPDELDAFLQFGALIDKGLTPALVAADGTIISLAANLEHRGAESTLGFLDELRAKAAAVFDALSREFDQSQRFKSLDADRKEFMSARDEWWTAYNKVVGDVRDLPANMNRQQIEQFTGADVRAWHAANNAALTWAQTFITKLPSEPVPPNPERRLSDEQKKLVASELKTSGWLPDAIWIRYANGCDECRRYASDLAAALTVAGWNGDFGRSLDEREELTGLKLNVADMNAKPHTAALLALALEEASIDFEWWPMSGMEKERVILWVYRQKN